MNVNLTPDLERLVQEKVASGLYEDQSGSYVILCDY